MYAFGKCTKCLKQHKIKKIATIVNLNDIQNKSKTTFLSFKFRVRMCDIKA